MPARVCFALPPVVRLAEHAIAAPATNLRRPGTRFTTTPALRLIVEDLAGQPPVVYLVGCGAPRRPEPGGTPTLVYAETAPPDLDCWPAQAHEVFDLNQLVPAGTITGRRLPVARGWYLPLHQPARRPAIDVIRAASTAGYTHLAVDTPSLTIAVSRRRHRQPAHATPR